MLSGDVLSNRQNRALDQEDLVQDRLHLAFES